MSDRFDIVSTPGAYDILRADASKISPLMSAYVSDTEARKIKTLVRKCPEGGEIDRPRDRLRHCSGVQEWVEMRSMVQQVQLYNGQHHKSSLVATSQF